MKLNADINGCIPCDNLSQNAYTAALINANQYFEQEHCWHVMLRDITACACRENARIIYPQSSTTKSQQGEINLTIICGRWTEERLEWFKSSGQRQSRRARSRN